jgi:hypothetical protein
VIIEGILKVWVRLLFTWHVLLMFGHGHHGCGPGRWTSRHSAGWRRFCFPSRPNFAAVSYTCRRPIYVKSGSLHFQKGTPALDFERGGGILPSMKGLLNMPEYRAIAIAGWTSRRLRFLCNGRYVHTSVLKFVLGRAPTERRLPMSVRKLGQSNRCDETRTLNRGYPPLMRRLASNQGV